MRALRTAEGGFVLDSVLGFLSGRDIFCSCATLSTAWAECVAALGTGTLAAALAASVPPRLRRRLRGLDALRERERRGLGAQPTATAAIEYRDWVLRARELRQRPFARRVRASVPRPSFEQEVAFALRLADQPWWRLRARQVGVLRPVLAADAHFGCWACGCDAVRASRDPRLQFGLAPSAAGSPEPMPAELQHVGGVWLTGLLAPGLRAQERAGSGGSAGVAKAVAVRPAGHPRRAAPQPLERCLAQYRSPPQSSAVARPPVPHAAGATVEAMCCEPQRARAELLGALLDAMRCVGDAIWDQRSCCEGGLRREWRGPRMTERFLGHDVDVTGGYVTFVQGIDCRGSDDAAEASVLRAGKRVRAAPDATVLHAARLHLGAGHAQVQQHSGRNAAQRLSPFVDVFREQLAAAAADTPAPELTAALWLAEADDAELQARYRQRLGGATRRS